MFAGMESRDLPQRRSVRLLGYNYSQAGAYFVTICAWDMNPLFGRITSGQMQLSPLGSIVQDCWIEIPRHFGHAELDEFVVTPNHLHGILTLVGAHHGVPFVAGARRADVGARHGVPSPVREQFSRPVSGSLASILRLFKQAVAKRAREVGAHDVRARHGVPLQQFRRPDVRPRDGVPPQPDVGARHGVPVQIWQRNYYEHIIRNPDELEKIREYIRTNPLQWACDRYNPNRGVLVRAEAGNLVLWKDQT